ncbi:SpoIIE family protein phosphatase [Solirubrobacter sp. CPCC 204708]|uniref:SpoIIE family protein phosphatase n=1 Tax=Solirubrobacter deserti TaxID=2282478 RepID=A0ABT4RJ97_9ACTN|nr:SpoIIE family protein phosphatase [Solirubrobacter deserti]MBE2317693.1 SpoIIE family protein phosphatase [Solirubrobacter deserti]MDA0138644.1 SpoIIE family protein phosphatase [Solirubrobacter deserti]
MRSARSSDPSGRVTDLSAEELYEQAPCGYLSSTPDGTIVRVNETFLRWTGYRRQDLVAVKRFQDLLSPGGRIYHETHYAPLLRMQGSVREIAVDILTADRRRLPVLVNSALVTDEAGEPELVRTTLFDARERKAYERELLAARDRERQAREAVERLHAQSQATSHALQQSLLASEAPRDPRFDIVTLYQPAVEDLEVGGDWHDAFVLPDGRLGLVVGDVVGRGLIAATAMGQLRSAVRALAIAGLGPVELIRALDAFVAGVDAAKFATLVYAEVEPDLGTATIASAGHLPPVLVTAAGEARLWFGGRSTPVGIQTPALPRAEAELALNPGDTLVLYTDGLIERRTESIDTGLARLLAAAADDPHPDALRRNLIAQGPDKDDVCVLAFTRTHAAE